MKRTLLEILGALAVLVLLASFQHQIGRLKEQNIDVATLRDLVEETAANAGSRQDILEIQHRLTELVDDRLALLENKVSNATEKAKEATFLKEELDAARREAALLKAQITRDMTVTRELVDSYHSELRAQDRTVMETLSANRDVLSRISGKVLPDAGQLTRELLSPTVQLNGEDTVGSGTLISSVIDARTGKADSHVLTSYHVVRNILADSPRAKTEGIPITFYRGEEQVQVRADVVSYDEAIDAALLKLRSDETFEPVARVLPREQAEVVKVWDDVYAIGCPLGNDPIPTSGTISSMHNVLSGTNYWMIKLGALVA